MTQSQAKTVPDTPGRWWFRGNSIGTGPIKTITFVQNRPFEVVEEHGQLLITVPFSGEMYDRSDLVGQWAKEGVEDLITNDLGEWDNMSPLEVEELVEGG